MKDFSVLPLFLQQSLARLGIVKPTPIQEKAILPLLQKKDVLGSAQTGTGKTFAFLLPLWANLTENPAAKALILSPTRELAQQTESELQKLADEQHTLKSALLIGGDNIHKQYAALRRKPRVIIATPGRLLDHIGRKTLDLSDICFWVLDETDRMLDMGFIEDMRQLAALLPKERQTALFSATLPPEIIHLAESFLRHPVRVQIGSVTSAAEGVLQEIVYVDIREKLPQLLHELNTRKGAVLVFTRTKHGAERLAKELKRYGQKVSALHGELRQNRRKQVLDFFRSGAIPVLVATDLAARGIDVPHIAHVINYDLPQCPEDYIHRIGRTGRAGSVGNAISFISSDKEKWQEICKVTRFASPVKVVQKTIVPLPKPKFVAQEESAVRKKKQTLSKATALAKKLLAEGEVYLPQGNELPAPKKPQTFHKAVQAARIIEQTEENPFHILKVGISKRKLKATVVKKTHRKKSKNFNNKKRYR